MNLIAHRWNLCQNACPIEPFLLVFFPYIKVYIEHGQIIVATRRMLHENKKLTICTNNYSNRNITFKHHLISMTHKGILLFTLGIWLAHFTFIMNSDMSRKHRIFYFTNFICLNTHVKWKKCNSVSKVNNFYELSKHKIQLSIVDRQSYKLLPLTNDIQSLKTTNSEYPTKYREYTSINHRYNTHYLHPPSWYFH